MQGMHARKRLAFASRRACLFVLVCMLGVSIAAIFVPARVHASSGTIVQHQVTGPQVPKGQKGTLTLACDSGEQLLNGGFYGNAFEGAVYVVEDYPSAANAWTVTVDNTTGPSWIQMTVTINCLQAPYSLAASIVSAASSGSGTTVASCPTGSTLLSGGFAGSTPPQQSSPATNGWQSDAANVYALCATQIASAAPTASATFTAPTTFTSAGATATCTTGQVTGGGFSKPGGYYPTVTDQGSATGWGVAVEGSGYYPPVTVTVWAVCVNLPVVDPLPTPTMTLTPTPPVTPTTTPTLTPTVTPPSGIHITYRVNAQWPGGFVVSITIANGGSTTVNGWTLQFTFPGDQKITNLYNGTWSQVGQQVTIKNMSYNAILKPGQSLQLGFNGTFTTNNTSPTTFTFNGAPTN